MFHCICDLFHQFLLTLWCTVTCLCIRSILRYETKIMSRHTFNQSLTGRYIGISLVTKTLLPTIYPVIIFNITVPRTISHVLWIFPVYTFIIRSKQVRFPKDSLISRKYLWQCRNYLRYFYKRTRRIVVHCRIDTKTW